ncbi:MAG: hypothetical protein QG669_568 [Patescibacteria group bacterium]|nr:hypothetical protein [Patescibacteria group bacterium]
MKTFKIVSVLMLISALITYPAYKYWPGPAILNALSGSVKNLTYPLIAPVTTFGLLFLAVLALLLFVYFLFLIKFVSVDEEKYWQ